MRFNPEKFKALVQYICYRCDNPRLLGKVKLNKILWFSDMLNFEATGKALTGESYVKRQFGPVPSHIDSAVEELQQENKLSVRLPDAAYEPTLFFAAESPDLEAFSSAEISLVERMIEDICRNHTATSISNLTHDVIYDLAEMGETIPYEAFLASEPGEINARDLEWARTELAGAAG